MSKSIKTRKRSSYSTPRIRWSSRPLCSLRTSSSCIYSRNTSKSPSTNNQAGKTTKNSFLDSHWTRWEANNHCKNIRVSAILSFQGLAIERWGWAIIVRLEAISSHQTLSRLSVIPLRDTTSRSRGHSILSLWMSQQARIRPSKTSFKSSLGVEIAIRRTPSSWPNHSKYPNRPNLKRLTLFSSIKYPHKIPKHHQVTHLRFQQRRCRLINKKRPIDQNYQTTPHLKIRKAAIFFEESRLAIVNKADTSNHGISNPWWRTTISVSFEDDVYFTLNLFV